MYLLSLCIEKWKGSHNEMRDRVSIRSDAHAVFLFIIFISIFCPWNQKNLLCHLIPIKWTYFNMHNLHVHGTINNLLPKDQYSVFLFWERRKSAIITARLKRCNIKIMYLVMYLIWSRIQINRSWTWTCSDYSYIWLVLLQWNVSD
jgi:hypothetical protein